MVTLTESYELEDFISWHWSQEGNHNVRTVRLEIFIEARPRFVAPFSFFASDAPSVTCQSEPTKTAESFVARCDNTDALLLVGQGWWHVLGTSFDLCHAEWQKLPADERGRFTLIVTPADLAADAPRYLVKVRMPPVSIPLGLN